MWHLSFHMNDGRMTRTIPEACVRDSRGMFQCEITERIQARRPQKWNCRGIHSEGYGGMQHWEITLGCYSRRRQWETTVGAAVFGNWEVCTRNATMGNYDGKPRLEARNVCIADFRAGRIHLWCYNGKLRWKLQWETVIQLEKKRRTWRRHILSMNFNSIDDFQTPRRICATTSFLRI